MSTRQVSGGSAGAGGRPHVSGTRPAAPVVVMKPRTRVVRIALAGCGVVGGSLVRLLQERGQEIADTRGLHLQLGRVLVRDPARARELTLPAGTFTTDPGELLEEEHDVLVEAIGGLDPAERLARETLARGRHFVTANKALVAEAGPELAALAEASGADLDFEAAVAGGVPVVRALRGSLGESGIVSVRGVLNGTTNYLLERLAQGSGYAQALAEAQAKGFAEADPSRDVDGRDAAAKVAILAWLAFGVDPSRLPVRTRGLLPDPELLGAAASLFGGVPRLLAEGVRLPTGVVAAVEPAVVSAGSEMAAVRAEHNLVLVQSRWNGLIRLAGPGAGGMPTSSALLSDVLESAGPLPHPATPPARPPARPGSAAAAGDDARELRWIVAVRASGARELRALQKALARAGVRAHGCRLARQVAAARSEPATWERMATAAALLAREIGEAAILRDERAI